MLIVTHDQEEALVMSDRILLLANGVIEQMGTPEDLFERPRTVFAAYNHYAGAKEIIVYPYNNHEGGETYQQMEKIRFAQRLLA